MLNYEHKPNLNYRKVVNVTNLVSRIHIASFWGSPLSNGYTVYKMSRALLSEFTYNNNY